MKGSGPRPPPPPVDVLPETEATREQRQKIGHAALVSLCRWSMEHLHELDAHRLARAG